MVKSLFLIIIFLTAANAGLSQSIDVVLERDEFTRIRSLKGVNQHGQEYGFPHSNPKPVLIFFLPKTESRTEAMEFLEEIRIYLKKVNNGDHDQTERLLVVEPYRSGRLANRMFNAKMRGEGFRVIRDLNSNIIREVNQKSDKILLWLIDETGLILHQTNRPFREHDILRVNSILLKLNQLNKNVIDGD